jgi:hypothetical protein
MHTDLYKQEKTPPIGREPKNLQEYILYDQLYTNSIKYEIITRLLCVAQIEISSSSAI